MPSTTADREIVVSRVLNAPPDLVFAAFTEKEHVENWWMPKGSQTHEWDAQPGGVWRYSMPAEGGAMYPFKVTFVEISKPTRLVYDYGGEGDPDPVRTNVTFEDEGGKTKVTLQLVFASVAAFEEAKGYGAVGGATQALKELETYLAKR
ncbi:MAG: SRPBCC domain-containing protein [Anaerolineales bacterium]